MGTHYEQLSLEDRIEIYRLHADGKSNSAIAAAIGRHKTTIGRELERNGMPTKAWRGGYDPLTYFSLFIDRSGAVLCDMNPDVLVASSLSPRSVAQGSHGQNPDFNRSPQ